MVSGAHRRRPGLPPGSRAEDRAGSSLQQYDALRPPRERVRVTFPKNRADKNGQAARRSRHDRKSARDLRGAGKRLTPTDRSMGSSSQPESPLRTHSVSPLDLGKHAIDVADWIVVLCGRADDVQFLAGAAHRFGAPRQFERFPDPLYNRQTAAARHALNLLVIGILQDYL